MKALIKIILLIIFSVAAVYLLIWLFSKPVIAPATDYLLNIKKQFEVRKIIKIQEINLSESSSTVAALTSEGWRIIFENSSSPEKLALLLFNILDKEIKDQRQNLDYIDLRLENRAYYKLKE